MTGKYYKVNRLEYITSIHRRIYYCPGNIVIDNGNAININKNDRNENLGTNELLDNGVIVDVKKKKVEPYLEEKEDSFSKYFKNLNIESINISLEQLEGSDEKIKIIKINVKNEKEPVIIELNNLSQIIGYSNPYVKEIGNDFLHGNQTLKKLNLPNVEKIGDSFLPSGTQLEEINLPKVKFIGKHFMEDKEGFPMFDTTLRAIYLPEVEETEMGFMSKSNYLRLQKIYTPKLRKIEQPFLSETKNAIIDKTVGMVELRRKKYEKKLQKKSKKIRPKDIVETDISSQITSEEVKRGRDLFHRLIGRINDRSR